MGTSVTAIAAAAMHYVCYDQNYPPAARHVVNFKTTAKEDKERQQPKLLPVPQLKDNWGRIIGVVVKLILATDNGQSFNTIKVTIVPESI